MKKYIFTKNIYTIYALLLFGCMSITISRFLGAGAKNMLLIYMMALSPVFMLAYKKKYDKIDTLLLLFLVCISFLNYIYSQNLRISSWLYTICFVTSFIYLRDIVIRNPVCPSSILKCLTFLIHIYAVVLVIQQFCVLFSMPVINQYARWESPWKLASLSPEPSHLVRYMVFLLYSFILFREITMRRKYTYNDVKKDKMVWISYFWVMLTCQSTLGLFLVFVPFMRFINVRTLFQYMLLGVVLFSLWGILYKDSKLLIRINGVLSTIFTFSSAEIVKTDHSASYRIVPLFEYIRNANVLSIKFWLGSGMDSGKHFFQQYMFEISGDKTYDERDVNIGGFFNFLIDYGVATASILFMGLYNITKKIHDKYFVYLWIFIIMFESINTQHFWFSFFLLFLVSHYTKKYNNGKNKRINHCSNL